MAVPGGCCSEEGSPRVSLGCWHTPWRGHGRSCDTSPVQSPVRDGQSPVGTDTPGAEAARGVDVPGAAPVQISRPGPHPCPWGWRLFGVGNWPGKGWR